jgi:hypothetical protein
MLSIAAGIWNTSKIYKQRMEEGQEHRGRRPQRDGLTQHPAKRIDGGSGWTNLICSVMDGSTEAEGRRELTQRGVLLHVPAVAGGEGCGGT